MAASKISNDDIVFECPSCGQSMAIDRRGAGMQIPCSGCERPIKVPQHAELDGGEGALDTAEFGLSRLSASLKTLQEKQRALDALKSENKASSETLQKEIKELLKSLELKG